MAEDKTKGYLAVSESEKVAYYNSEKFLKENQLLLNQAFKGEVTDQQATYPKGLGAVHPFDFDKVEKVYKQIGLINGAVNVFTDSILGDFNVSVENKNSQAIIDDFLSNSNFMVALRSWINEGVLKGNGFMELDLDNSRVRVMNANYMYVKRTKSGKITEYNQFKGDANKFNLTRDRTKVIAFTPNQIAHLPLNKIPNDPYGVGYVWPSIVSVNNYALSELGMHKLLDRKAGAPIHVKVGLPGEAVNPEAIDSFKSKLQYMNNSTEWVTDGNVEMKVLDFGDIGKNLTDQSDHDIEQIAYGMGIPLTLLGKANVPEGLAKAQTQRFQKTVDSIRTLIEDVIEENILRPLLRANKLDESIEFEWEAPSEEDKNNKLKGITEMLKSPMISEGLRAALEIEYAEISGMEDVSRILISPKKAMQNEENRLRQEEEEIPQPEVPGAKPTANQRAKVIENTSKQTLTEEQAREMKLSEYVNITEIAGFNYSDYLIKILQKLRGYDFKELVATNLQEIELGLLPKKDIEKLRVILKDGFRKNKTIREIENTISKTIDLKDRVELKEDGSKIISLSKEKRPITIARTETVRLANAGLKDLYIENEIQQYRYLAAIDERTSDICMGLNGQVFNVKDGQPGINMPPMHVNCRSTIIGIV